MKKSRQRAKERYALRVDVAVIDGKTGAVVGCMLPADTYTQGRFRAMGFKRGDLVFAEFFKPRNPGFHRLIHRLGGLCAANIDAFKGMDAHKVLKRLQWEAGIGCEEMGVQVPGIGLAVMRWPLSMAFSEMDDGEFREVSRAFCRHIAERYWPELDEDRIELLAQNFVEEG